MKTYSVLVLLVCFSVGTSLAAVLGLPKNVEGYSSWTVVASNLPSGGEHRGKNKTVYANPIASKAWHQKSSMPVGSLVVKSPKGAAWVAIMEKTSKGWKYQELMLRKGRYVLGEESQASCIACHRQASLNDSLFTRTKQP